ncbi:MAG: ASKHA domain-containing protein [Cocleimonas sp.]
MTKHKVVFTPSGRHGEIEEGTYILTASRILGVDLASVCGGNGKCTQCKVQIGKGDFPKHQITSDNSHLSELSSAETYQINKEDLAKDFRLGCQTRIMGDVVIDIPSTSQTHDQVIRKAAINITIDSKPAVQLVTVDVEEAQMHIPSGDLERLQNSIEFKTGIPNISIEAAVLPQLQKALRKGKWLVTVAIYEQSKIIAIWSGEQKEAYGLAVDIGSTTIAGHLCELKSGKVLATYGLMNPQIRFGEDVMSRVSYAMMNTGGDKEMTDAVRSSICQMTDELIQSSGIDRDTLLDAVFVGNPIMHHLFLGIDPVELGGAPFALAVQTAVQLPASSLDLNLAAGAQVYIPPCIAGHVGADAAAVALAESPYNNDEMTLIIDVGTNAEIILGNKTKLVAASSPTGPAFEGAQIESGQRAAPGAIERVRIDPETLEPRFKIISSDLWSNEEGFDEVIKDTGVTGICGSGIIEAVATLFLAKVIKSDGVIDGSKSNLSPRVFENGKTWAYQLYKDSNTHIYIAQNDVRAIQLAKATLYASVRLLMDKINVPKIENIRFAGAFGAHIDPKYAMVLGMIPDCPLEQVKTVGNAAGTGARMALSSLASRQEIEDQVVKMDKIETAIESSFQEYFINAMAIPHKVDTFENLSQHITLPTQTSSDSDGSSDMPRVRRRRRSSRGGRPNKSL